MLHFFQSREANFNNLKEDSNIESGTTEKSMGKFNLLYQVRVDTLDNDFALHTGYWDIAYIKSDKFSTKNFKLYKICFNQTFFERFKIHFL